MRYWIRALLFATLLALQAGCGENPGKTVSGAPAIATEEKGGDGPTAPAPVKVAIDNFTYSPPRLTIPAGTKVTWVNHDDVPHTATSTAKPKAFDSGTLDTDGEFSHVFTTPGTYDYYCAVHPRMTGQIIVK